MKMDQVLVTAAAVSAMLIVSLIRRRRNLNK
ncbi:hypothetical protein IGI42_002369 [Enterococcus sp. AZ109]